MSAEQTTLIFFVGLIFVVPILIMGAMIWASTGEEESSLWRIVKMPLSNPVALFCLLFFGRWVLSIFKLGDWGLNFSLPVDYISWPFTVTQTFLLCIGASLIFQFIFRPGQFKSVVPLPDQVIDRWRQWCEEKWEMARNG